MLSEYSSWSWITVERGSGAEYEFEGVRCRGRGNDNGDKTTCPFSHWENSGSYFLSLSRNSYIIESCTCKQSSPNRAWCNCIFTCSLFIALSFFTCSLFYLLSHTDVWWCRLFATMFIAFILCSLCYRWVFFVTDIDCWCGISVVCFCVIVFSSSWKWRGC